MKRIGLLLIFFLPLAINSFGAWSYNGTSAYVDMSDNAVLDLPDGDWTLAGWFKPNSTAGTTEPPVISVSVSDSIYFAGSYYEASFADAKANDIDFYAQDAQADSVWPLSTSNPLSTNWTSYIAIRSGNTVTLYINGTSAGSATNAIFDAVTIAGVVRWGGTFDLLGFFGGLTAEWAKWDRALSTSEIAALKNGTSPRFFLNGLKWHVPMIRDYNEIKTGISITNHSSTAGSHPRIYYPN